MSSGLFQEFEKQTAEDWTEKLRGDLRGQPVESLLWKTQGISGRPFYTAENLDFEPFNYSRFSDEPTLFGDRHWVNYQPIVAEDDKAANKKALGALENGATGIVFQLSATPDWGVLLKDIQPAYCSLSFVLSEAIQTADFITSYDQYLSKADVDIEKVSGFISTAHSTLASIGKLKSLEVAVVKEENAALSLALTLAELIEKVDRLTSNGAQVEDCVSNAFFRQTISNDFFLEIAKHRALRKLAESVISAYGINEPSVQIISQAGPWTAEIDDPHSFMLHATTQAMSAIIGGTDGLIVQPFYNIFPEKHSLAERIARNISSILSEESYLNKMVDPAAGSYYIEELTHTLYNDALTLLQKIEDNGGLSKTDVEQLKSEAQ